MDKKTLEKLKRLREVLSTLSYRRKGRLSLNYRQYKLQRKMFEKLSWTLFEEIILPYNTRKRLHKEIRELMKEA